MPGNVGRGGGCVGQEIEMISVAWVFVLFVLLAYLSGSVPFGLLVGLWRGVDVRKAGSGNIGATNVGRLLGGKFFALVFILDLAKGLLPMLVGAWVIRRSGATAGIGTYLLWIGIGAAAIFGHMFSIFLRFKGGKGVATSTGVALGLFPYYTLPALAALLVFIIIILITRYVSVASVLAAIAFPIAYVLIGLAWRPAWPILGSQLPLLIFAVLVAVMIIYKHRANLARLRAGTELRVGQRRAA
jgi:acyl phosphate:glycerol-3-phosphate acyltransferase